MTGKHGRRQQKMMSLPIATEPCTARPTKAGKKMMARAGAMFHLPVSLINPGHLIKRQRPGRLRVPALTTARAVPLHGIPAATREIPVLTGNPVQVTVLTDPAWTGRATQGNGRQREAVSTARIARAAGAGAAGTDRRLLLGGTARNRDLANVQNLGRLFVEKFLLAVATAFQHLLKALAVGVYDEA